MFHAIYKNSLLRSIQPLSKTFQYLAICRIASLTGLVVKWLQRSNGYACVHPNMFQLLFGGKKREFGGIQPVFNARCSLYYNIHVLWWHDCGPGIYTLFRWNATVHLFAIEVGVSLVNAPSCSKAFAHIHTPFLTAAILLCGFKECGCLNHVQINP